MNNRDDDEGLIDLRTLSVPPRHGESATSAAFSMAPPPMTAGPSAEDAGSGPGARKTTILFAAGALAFVVLSGIGIAFAFRGEKAVKPPVEVANTPAAPSASAAASVTAPPSASAAADPSASAAASNDDDDDEKPKGKKPRPKGKGVAGKAHSTTAPVTPAKPADPCHCKGDFQCNIRCSANFKK